MASARTRSCGERPSPRPAFGAGRNAFWRTGSLEDGFDGLLRDKTRPSRIKPLSAEAAERLVALTLGDPPGETTHWTGALMAKAAGLSVSSVQRNWRAVCNRTGCASSSCPTTRQRPALRRQIARCRRAPCRSARTRHRPVGRRKEPDSGARPHPARIAAEERSRRNHDA